MTWPGSSPSSADQLARAARVVSAATVATLRIPLLVVTAERSLSAGLPLAAAASGEAALSQVEGVLPGLRARAFGTAIEGRALAGDVGGALSLVARFEADPAYGDLGAELRRRVGEAIVRATAQTGEWLDASDRLVPLRSPGEPPTTTALAAWVALQRGDLDQARLDAQHVIDGAAEGAAACEAMEVLGRIARGHDLELAQRWFRRAAAMAEAHGLALWRARALHEEATIAQLRTIAVKPLYAARVAAEAAGAPGLLTAVDFHISAVHAVRFEPAPALATARLLLSEARALGARRQEAWAWILVGNAHAVAGRRAQAAAAAREALALAPGDAEIAGMACGACEGLAALLAEDLPTALERWQAGIGALRTLGAPTPLPPWYLWSVLATVHDVEGDGGRRAREESAAPGLQVVAFVAGSAHLADAVAAGRAGDRVQAEAFLAAADACARRTPDGQGWYHLALRWVAPAAIADGWGAPAVWMPQAAVWFDEHGFGAVAAACRGLAQRAGAPQRRRRQGSSEVPAELRRRGVTGREMDVAAAGRGWPDQRRDRGAAVPLAAHRQGLCGTAAGQDRVGQPNPARGPPPPALNPPVGGSRRAWERRGCRYRTRSGSPELRSTPCPHRPPASTATTASSRTEANAAVVAALIQNFLRGDLDAVRAAFAAHAVWDLPGRGSLAGSYVGPDAIVGFLARCFELSGGTLRLELLDILASDRGAAHVQRVTAEGGGRRLDCVEVLAHEIVDGLIVRTHHRPDPYAIDAFFG